ncbi:MAG: M17 family peptidase N-terminal domain-containing protein [Myxococcales bacterium]
MELTFVEPNLRRLDEVSSEVISCHIWQDRRPFQGLAGLLDWRLSGRLSELTRSGFLNGTLGEVLLMPLGLELPFDKLLLFGLGMREDFADTTCRVVTEKLLRALEGLRIRRAVVELPGRANEAISSERAADLLLGAVGESPYHESWRLVENEAGRDAILRRTDEQRRRVRRL